MTAVAENLRTERIEIGTRCNVYRNLNLLKHGVVGWSVQAREGRRLRVKQHARCVLLSDVTFKHATEDQVRRVREEVREVCAWLKGTLQGSCLSRDDVPGVAEWDEPPTRGAAKDGPWRRLRCDPKSGRGDFHDEETGRTLESAKFVFVDAEGRAWHLPHEEESID